MVKSTLANGTCWIRDADGGLAPYSDAAWPAVDAPAAGEDEAAVDSTDTVIALPGPDRPVENVAVSRASNEITRAIATLMWQAFEPLLVDGHPERNFDNLKAQNIEVRPWSEGEHGLTKYLTYWRRRGQEWRGFVATRRRT